MSFLDQIGVLILTYNEAPNIGRVLDALRDFPEIVVLDSCSTDTTAEIAAAYPNVGVCVHPFDNHAAQWNHGLDSCGLERPWVLALDADYLLPRALIEEISRLDPSASVAGYRASFRYCINGKALSGSLYPPVVVLYRRAVAHYVQSGHTQRVIIEGAVAHLSTPIDHDDRKPLAYWLHAQQRYARLEVNYLLEARRADLRITDRLRLTCAAPILVFFYTLFWKRCIFDGWSGWFYVLQRLLYETMLALELLERRLGGVPAGRRKEAVATSSVEQDP